MLKRMLSLFLSLILCFTLTSCRSEAASREYAIRKLVTAALDIQYERRSAKLASVFTKEFVGDLPENFYKDSLSPYTITDEDFMETLKAEKDNTLTVAVRLEDTQGGYIQVLHIVRDHACYLIDKIEYDI